MEPLRVPSVGRSPAIQWKGPLQFRVALPNGGSTVGEDGIRYSTISSSGELEWWEGCKDLSDVIGETGSA